MVKNFEVLYFCEDAKKKAVIIELGTRTKPVVVKTAFAFRCFSSSKDLFDIATDDPELLDSEIIFFGTESLASDYIAKHPDANIPNIVKWNPNSFMIINSISFKKVFKTTTFIGRNYSHKCIDPKELEWQVSLYSFNLITNQFRVKYLI